MKMSEARAKALNPQCFDNRDKFIVIDETHGRPIESAPTEARAKRAVENLTDHERRNGRDTVYTYVTAE